MSCRVYRDFRYRSNEFLDLSTARARPADCGGSWGGWGDPLSGENRLSGSSPDGATSPGPCVVNCSNAHPAGLTARGTYRFHAGGVNVALADGSVRFLAESTSNRTFGYLVTRANGDVVPGEN